MSLLSPPIPLGPEGETPTYSAQDLMKGGDIARITLGDQTYVLRITRAGKLILTK